MTAPALSVAEFAERVLKVRLWPHQMELVESDAFITTVAAARRTGKSTVAEILSMWTAFSYRACKVIILSASQDSARRLTESIGQRLNANRLTQGAVVDDFATRIKLSNGSEIISLPASQRQVRGYGSGVRLVVLDECGFMDGLLYRAASYVALDEKANGSRLLLLGTPWGPADHFFRRAFQAGLDGDPDHKTLHWTAAANPKLDAAYLERQRDRVSPAEYAAEVLGEWSDAVGALFPRPLLDRQTADIVIPPLAALRGPARGIIACDWGYSYDRSAAVAIFRLPVAGLNPDEKPLPRFVCFPYVWPQATPMHQVVETVATNLSPFSYIATEVNGIGGMPSQELYRWAKQRKPPGVRKWFFVNTSATTKTTGYGLLLSLMERGQLILPRDPALLRQLAGLQFTQGERGFAKIEAENAAVHDDVCDALYLATLPHKPPTAHRVVCRLAMLAGSTKAPADARAPAVDCPVVETGAGLRVPQVPTLQSVNGDQWTAYAPVKQTRPEGVQQGRFFVKTTTGAVT